MSTYRNLVVGIGRKYRETKDDPHGTVKIIREFEHVNATKNVIANASTFADIRATYNDLYGTVIYHVCNIDNFTDYDICRLIATEVTPDDNMIIDDDIQGNTIRKVLKNRTTGSIVAVGMDDSIGNVHFYKCNVTNTNKDRRITFKKLNFRKFFYTFADDRKGFHTGARIDNSIAYSKRHGVDGTVKLFMAPIKGGTEVTNS